MWFIRTLVLKDKYLFYYNTDSNSLTHNSNTGMNSDYRKKFSSNIKWRNWIFDNRNKKKIIFNK